ncbi:helix-turn-helix transcriptional regulator [Endozoicomonas sp. ONNA1]|uniref:helix-turn-helix transcriptional regulator n=1 Tax=Endozoicomonas sp. ONNA1 TaxID=2828740 RepID=UPI0034D2BFDF
MNKKNYSEKRLARELGVSQQAVSKWLTGKSVPKLQLFYNICVAVDVSPNDLLLWLEDDR